MILQYSGLTGRRSSKLSREGSAEGKRELCSGNRRSARRWGPEGVAELEEGALDLSVGLGDLMNLHAAAAALTGLDVDGEDPSQQPGPEVASRRRGGAALCRRRRRSGGRAHPYPFVDELGNKLSSEILISGDEINLFNAFRVRLRRP